MQTIERGLQVVDFWRYSAVLWPFHLPIFGAFLALHRGILGKFFCAFGPAEHWSIAIDQAILYGI